MAYVETTSNAEITSQDPKILAPKLRRWQDQWYQSCDPQSICLGPPGCVGMPWGNHKISWFGEQLKWHPTCFRIQTGRWNRNRSSCVNWKVLHRHHLKHSMEHPMNPWKNIERLPCLKIDVPIDSQFYAADFYHRTSCFFFFGRDQRWYWPTSI